MNKQKSFSSKARIKSIGHAFYGLHQAIKTEHNIWIHTGFTILVLLAGVLFRVSKHEALFLILSVGLVWCTELINTAIEKAMNHINPEYNPAVKIIKDIAAAAVLVAAITAFSIGLIVFLPKLFSQL